MPLPCKHERELGRGGAEISGNKRNDWTCRWRCAFSCCAVQLVALKRREPKRPSPAPSQRASTMLGPSRKRQEPSTASARIASEAKTLAKP